MNRGFASYWIGIILLISIISFLFYKSIFSDRPLNDLLNMFEETQSLQVKLHRDLLRYRNNRIKQYDSLNRTMFLLEENIADLNKNEVAIEELGTEAITKLQTLINDEAILIEDFKTHHSILQNSLSYIYYASTDLFSTSAKTQSKEKQRITAELITLLLEYNENPGHDITNKIYPLVDKLSQEPDASTQALINHSLMIIERLPKIDNILARFNSLNVENEIITLKNNVSEMMTQDNSNSQIFNTLLFLCTIYLIFYILYIFMRLKKNEEQAINSNNQLNNEVQLRAKTEKALFALVDIDNNLSNHNDDRILYLLNALCTALDVEYAYISRSNSLGITAEVIGLLDHGMYKHNFTYHLKNTPCEEVLNTGRLIHNTDFANYFPEQDDGFLKNADSYIGINLIDKNENVIGMMAIASVKKISDTNLAENILSIATSRAIIELERQIENNNTKRYQKGLALIDEWIARLITKGYDQSTFFKNICRAAREITQSQLAAFPVLNKDNKSYHFISADGTQSDELDSITLQVEDGGLCTWTILNNESLLINDLSNDRRAKIQLAENFKFNAALLSPVTLKNQPYGAIAVFKENDDFDSIDEQLITQLSQSIQMAIINMQLVNDIRSERERAEVTLHSIGDAVITTNVDGKIEYMNKVAQNLTAWKFDDAKNKSIQDVFKIKDVDTDEEIHDIVRSCLDENISINKSMIILISKNGNEKHIESSISPILKTSGNAEGVVIVFHDETQRRQLENTIKHQAAHDALTDLLNRDTFNDELTAYIFDTNHNDKEHVLCYLDLDNFKLINDTAGQNAGDQCLIQTTSVIQSCIRSDDILGRLGGDEFGLILQNCDQDSANRICKSIAQAITKMSFKWEGCDYKLSVSIGISPLNKSIIDSPDAIRKADLACYTAKDKGKGNIYIYEEKDSELIRHQEESYWATHINEAIENNRLRLFGQRIVSFKNNPLHNNHVEILVRLLDDDNQLIMPNAFIPAAERYNLMHLIDYEVIKKTFSFMNEYADIGDNNTYFSINLSGNSINQENIIEDIKALINRFDITANQICFEITETSAIKNLKQAKRLITELQELGVRFALDDFGSGLSSFQYLKSLPVNYLKIDGSFVADMVNNNIDHAMVAAINEVAHIMGIETIAEYVENDQIIKKLQKLKVDFGQGYGIEQPRLLEQTLGYGSSQNSPSLHIVDNKP